MEAIFLRFVRMSLAGSVVILAILLLRRKRSFCASCA